MHSLNSHISKLRRRSAHGSESGVALVEYALIISLLSIGSLAVLLALSGGINGAFTTITGAL
jgi:Flp pilus assembly pilin Flp